MLTSRAYSAFICLRCELRKTRPRTLVGPPPSRSKFSTASRLRDGAAELETLPDAQPPELKITKETSPRDRIRRRKGKIIRETTAPLSGLKTLGHDANILVLTEFGDDPPANREETVHQLAESQDVPDLIASLQEEGEALTPAELYKRIESLRPQSPNVDEQFPVTQAKFTKLAQLLIGGFTQEQLSRYYVEAKKNYRKGVKSAGTVRATANQNTQVNRTEWHQSASASAERVLTSVPGSIANRKLTGKMRLASGILRDLWNLVFIDETEGLGELELAFRPWMLSLLAAGDHGRLLSQIGKSRRVKLEVFWQHNVLRITADKNTAEYAANDVESLVRNWQERTVDLEPWLRHLEDRATPENNDAQLFYREQDLKSVMSTTNVDLQWCGSHTLLIRGLDESAVTEAERMLLGFLPLRNSIIYSIDGQRLHESRDTAYMLPMNQNETPVSRKHGEDTMGRWLLAIPRHSAANLPGVTEGADKTNGHRKNIVEQALVALQQPVISANESQSAAEATSKVSYWSPKYEVKLRAKFGQTLFSIQEMTASAHANQTVSASSINDMCFSYPGLAHLLASRDFVKASHIPPPSLVYDLIPAPNQVHLDPDQVAPAADVRMRMNADGTSADLLRLGIYFHKYHHDILFPELVTDIRFAQTARLTLVNSRRDSKIEDWVNFVRANIVSGDRLTAPSLELAVPKWTISGFPLDSFDTVPVQYIFSNVRNSSSLSGRIFSQHLVYSIHQAGKTQSNRMSAYHKLPDTARGSVEMTQEARGEFVNQCIKIAEKLTAAARNTKPPKMRKLRMQNGERRVRRQAERSQMLNAEDNKTASRAEDVTNEEDKSIDRSDVVEADQPLSIEGSDLSSNLIQDVGQSKGPLQ